MSTMAWLNISFFVMILSIEVSDQMNALMICDLVQDFHETDQNHVSYLNVV